jgi:hypothetical protein
MRLVITRLCPAETSGFLAGSQLFHKGSQLECNTIHILLFDLLSKGRTRIESAEKKTWTYMRGSNRLLERIT